MNPSYVLLLAFLIGVIGGLRTMTAPAVVAWAANRHWLNLDNSPLALMGSFAAVIVFALGALGELVIDKLPSTPSRTRLLGLVGRCVLGGLSGAALAVAGAQSMALGGALGVAGAIAGAFAGYEVRKRLVRAKGSGLRHRAPGRRSRDWWRPLNCVALLIGQPRNISGWIY